MSDLKALEQKLETYGLPKFLTDHKVNLAEQLMKESLTVDQIGDDFKALVKFDEDSDNYKGKPYEQMKFVALMEQIIKSDCNASILLRVLQRNGHEAAISYLKEILIPKPDGSESTIAIDLREDGPWYVKRAPIKTKEQTQPTGNVLEKEARNATAVVTPVRVGELLGDQSPTQLQQHISPTQNSGTDTPASTGDLNSDTKISMMMTVRYHTAKNVEKPFSVKDLLTEAQNDFNNSLQENSLGPLLNALQRGQNEEKVLTTYDVQSIRSGKNDFDRNDKLIECLKKKTREIVWGKFLDALQEIGGYDQLDILFHHFSELCKKNSVKYQL